MYAVVATGGKQYRVEEGQRLQVERVGADVGSDITLTPVMLVDGDAVLATPAELDGVSVSAKVVGASKGKKVVGFTYKNKTNQRKRWGHRQGYDDIEITKITKG